MEFFIKTRARKILVLNIDEFGARNTRRKFFENIFFFAVNQKSISLLLKSINSSKSNLSFRGSERDSFESIKVLNSRPCRVEILKNIFILWRFLSPAANCIRFHNHACLNRPT